MFNLNENIINIGLWTLFAILIIWTWCPALIAWMGGTKSFYTGPSPVPEKDPFLNAPDYLYWQIPLHQADYTLIGDIFYSIRFFSSHWQMNNLARLYYSRQLNTWAILHRSPEPINTWNTIEFITLLSDGGMVLTKNIQIDPGEGDENDNEMILIGHPSFNFTEIEGIHVEELAQLRRSGRKSDSDSDAERLLQQRKLRTDPLIKEESQALAKKFFSLSSILHASVSIPIVYILGIGTWAFPLVNISFILIMRLGEWSTKKQIAWNTQMAFRELQKMNPR